MADFGVDFHFVSFLAPTAARYRATAMALSCLLVTEAIGSKKPALGRVKTAS
jgi:hypothetical protein